MFGTWCMVCMALQRLLHSLGAELAAAPVAASMPAQEQGEHESQYYQCLQADWGALGASSAWYVG